MAEAKVIEVTQTQVIGVTLHLSPEEARELRRLLSQRALVKETMGVWDALQALRGKGLD